MSEEQLGKTTRWRRLETAEAGATMIEIDQETEIDASPAEVFDFIADPRNHLKFTPSLMDVSEVEDHEVGKKGAYTFKMVGTSLDGRFADVTFDRPNERTYELEGGLDGTVSWKIEDADGGSRVRYKSTLDLPGPDILDAVTAPVAKRFLGREAESTIKNLKVLLEEGEQEAEKAV